VVCLSGLLQNAQELAGCVQNTVHADFSNVFSDIAYVSTSPLNIISDVLNGESALISTAT
jgi:hypothetical protein